MKKLNCCVINSFFFFFILCLAVNCDGVLQSTVLAGHALRPDFDMSAIVGE